MRWVWGAVIVLGTVWAINEVDQLRSLVTGRN